MLEKAVGELSVCYLKGRSNYLCIEKFNHLRKNDLSPSEVHEYNLIEKWQETTETGDRAELSTLPDSSTLWKRINGRHEACTGKKCPRYDDCFVNLAREDARDANIVIVNHHLFFSDLVLGMKNPMAAVLPPAGAVVFDEAHEMEDVASESFGISVSNRRIAEMVTDTHRSLFGYKESSSIFQLCEELTRRFNDMTLLLPIEMKQDRVYFRERVEWLKKYAEIYKGVMASLTKLQKEMEMVKYSDEAALLAGRVRDLITEMRYLFESDDTITVVWLERRPSVKAGVFNTHIIATPIKVADLLRDTLFEKFDSVVLCSATLAVQNRFEHVRKTLGIDESKELIVASPFKYRHQAALYLPPNMPRPEDDNAFPRYKEVIEQILSVSKGRAFVLFTSYSDMTRMHAALDGKIPFPILLHGTMSRKELLDRFRATPNAVLFGTASFWQGVDVQGDQLSCVIIYKLPFAVPTDPVVIARSKAIQKDGGNGFFDYMVPNAVIALKQGFGRLVRSVYDRGILAILDPRIQHKRYGHIFLESLPEYTITTDLKVAAEFLKPGRPAKAI